MDARVKQLVNMIEDAQPVAVAVLAKRLEVSERAVRNYIHRARSANSEQVAGSPAELWRAWGEGPKAMRRCGMRLPSHWAVIGDRLK